MRVRKKPIEVEAVQWTGINKTEIDGFMGKEATWVDLSQGYLLNIETLEGTMAAFIGDWIIKGVKGEFYPCKPDIFDQTYEVVTDE